MSVYSLYRTPTFLVLVCGEYSRKKKKRKQSRKTQKKNSNKIIKRFACKKNGQNIKTDMGKNKNGYPTRGDTTLRKKKKHLTFNFVTAFFLITKFTPKKKKKSSLVFKHNGIDNF